MFELPKVGSEVSNYDGSRVFLWLANMVGLSVDLVNFLIAQILALFLASIFRSFLHPSKASAEIRHICGLSLGLFFGYFCFGQQAIHIAGLPAICYIVIRTLNPRIVQRAVMIVALVYLSCIHLHRLIYDYGSYSLDITGPLMIITQKCTSLAFSIHDGFTREHEDLTKAQQYHAIKKLPSALEYFSYMLHFQGLMAGPMVFYKDYIDFIEGYHIIPHPNANGNLDKNFNSKQIVLEPSPMKSVVRKVIGSFVCAFIFMKFITMYPIRSLKDSDFVESTSFLYKFWYMTMATTVIRFKYYHAWLLAEAICNNSGLGFNGYDKDGSPKWDLLANINVFAFEFGTNFRDSINNWNMGTNHWLRTVVYERVPKAYGTVLTFSLSALWHGFYPGYYITFATGAVFVVAARAARRSFRHRFQATQFSRMFYDILTCFITRVFLGYCTFPFVLLEFMPSLRLYLNIFMCLHLVAVATILILPKILRGPPRSSASRQNLSSTSGIRSDDNSNSSNANRSEDHAYPGNPATTKKSLVDIVPTSRNEAVSVKHDECEMDNLSQKLKEKIDIEARNFEELIDKTVTGIVELKDEIMRMNESDNHLFITADGLRKRNTNVDNIGNSISISSNNSNIVHKNSNNMKTDGVDTFLKKEIDAINAAVQQANVLPAVLSNGHAK